MVDDIFYLQDQGNVMLRSEKERDGTEKAENIGFRQSVLLQRQDLEILTNIHLLN